MNQCNQCNHETSVNIEPTVIRKCLLPRENYSATMNSDSVNDMKDLWKRSFLHLGCLTLLDR